MITKTLMIILLCTLLITISGCQEEVYILQRGNSTTNNITYNITNNNITINNITNNIINNISVNESKFPVNFSVSGSSTITHRLCLFNGTCFDTSFSDSTGSNNYPTNVDLDNTTTNLTINIARNGLSAILDTLDLSNLFTLKSLFNSENTSVWSAINNRYLSSNPQQFKNDTYNNATYYLLSNPRGFINSSYANNTYYLLTSGNSLDVRELADNTTQYNSILLLLADNSSQNKTINELISNNITLFTLEFTDNQSTNNRITALDNASIVRENSSGIIYNSLINCANITGGSDSDYCNDGGNTGAGSNQTGLINTNTSFVSSGSTSTSTSFSLITNGSGSINVTGYGKVRVDAVLDVNSAGGLASTGAFIINITYPNGSSQVSSERSNDYSGVSDRKSTPITFVASNGNVNGIYNYSVWLRRVSGTGTLTINNIDMVATALDSSGANITQVISNSNVNGTSINVTNSYVTGNLTITNNFNGTDGSLGGFGICTASNGRCSNALPSSASFTNLNVTSQFRVNGTSRNFTAGINGINISDNKYGNHFVASRSSGYIVYRNYTRQDYATINNTVTTIIDNFNITLPAMTNYSVLCTLWTSSAAATTGEQFRLNATGGAIINLTYETAVSATTRTPFVNHGVVDGYAFADTGSGGTNVMSPSFLGGSIETRVNSTQLTYHLISEIISSSVRIVKGSNCIYEVNN